MHRSRKNRQWGTGDLGSKIGNAVANKETSKSSSVN